MYFTNFKNIDYPFISKDGTVKTITIVDVTKNVRIRKLMETELSSFETYSIQLDDTPEIVSEKLYGTPYYHWVIMLLNGKFNYINDFPLSSKIFDTYVTKKYGNGNEYKLHHCEKSINNRTVIVDTPAEVIKPTDTTDPDYQTKLQEYNLYADFISSYGVTNMDYEIKLNDDKRVIKVVPVEIITAFIQEMDAL